MSGFGIVFKTLLYVAVPFASAYGMGRRNAKAWAEGTLDEGEPFVPKYPNLQYAAVDRGRFAGLLMALSVVGAILMTVVSFINAGIADRVGLGGFEDAGVFLDVLENIINCGLLWLVYSIFYRSYAEMWTLSVCSLGITVLGSLVSLLSPEEPTGVEEITGWFGVSIIVYLAMLVLWIVMYCKARGKYSPDVCNLLLAFILCPLLSVAGGMISVWAAETLIHGYSTIGLGIAVVVIADYLPYIIAYSILVGKKPAIVPVDRSKPDLWLEGVVEIPTQNITQPLATTRASEPTSAPAPPLASAPAQEAAKSESEEPAAVATTSQTIPNSVNSAESAQNQDIENDQTGETDPYYRDLESKKKRKKIILICAGVVGAALIVVGIVYGIPYWREISGSHGFVNASDDDDTGTVYITDDEEYESVTEYEDAESIAQNSANLPSWVPSDFQKALKVRELERFSDDGEYAEWLDENGLRGSLTGTGYINEYPVRFKINIADGGAITGKYAYESTLEKYGDGSSSWFTLKGSLLTSNHKNYIGFVSYKPDTHEPFEYWLVSAPTLNEVGHGHMINVNYDKPGFNGTLYDVSISFPDAEPLMY